MTYPRHALVSLEATPFYHVQARCMRRAWLCGVDEYAGKDYSHRKSWVLERLTVLCGMFAIDSCAFAVLIAYAKDPLLLPVVKSLISREQGLLIRQRIAPEHELSGRFESFDDAGDRFVVEIGFLDLIRCELCNLIGG